jgi:hypothetical protein
MPHSRSSVGSQELARKITRPSNSTHTEDTTERGRESGAKKNEHQLPAQTIPQTSGEMAGGDPCSSHASATAKPVASRR